MGWVKSSARGKDPGWGCGGIVEIGYTRGTFEQLLPACGLGDRNNFKINRLKRGRLPSGCTHLP